MVEIPHSVSLIRIDSVVSILSFFCTRENCVNDRLIIELRFWNESWSGKEMACCPCSTITDFLPTGCPGTFINFHKLWTKIHILFSIHKKWLDDCNRVKEHRFHIYSQPIKRLIPITHSTEEHQLIYVLFGEMDEKHSLRAWDNTRRLWGPNVITVKPVYNDHLMG